MTSFLSEYVDSDKTFIKELANKAVTYQALFENKDITKEEYVELLQDLKSQEVIGDNAELLAKKESLNTALNNIIKLASMV
jgi:hypothetical protein